MSDSWGTSTTIDAGGLRVGVRVAGQGDPIVLLHGFPQTSHEWRRVAPVLSRNRLVVAPDQRGFGSTGRPYPPRMTRALMVRDLQAALDAFGLAQVDLVGHDSGGLIASAFAFRHPERVRRLVLIDTAVTRIILRAAWHFVWFKIPGLAEQTFKESGDEFVRGGLTGLCRTADALADGDIEEYVRGFRDPATHQIAISLYRNALPIYRAVDGEATRFARVLLPELRAAWEAGIGNHPLWNETATFAPKDTVKTVSVPTLWIYATALGRPNAAFRAQFERAFPDLRELELDCGHWIPEERPGALSDALLDFLG